MNKFKITVSNNKKLVGFENKNFELSYDKSWVSCDGVLKVADKSSYKLTLLNLLKTSTKLTDESDSVIFETHLLWSGSIEIITKSSRLLLKQNILALKNSFSIFEKDKEIINMTVDIKYNTIKSFDFEVFDSNIEDLELLLFIIANSSLFYLNLKKIVL